jgi:Spy/CpxP family protein refolding chaperone
VKNIIIMLLLLLNSVTAEESLENPFLKDDNFPMGYSLLSDSMPNFMHLYMKGGAMHKMNLTAEQEEAIEEVFASRPQKVMKTAREIKNLETKLVLAVIEEGKSAKDVEGLINEIAKKRKEMVLLQIECLRVFKKTLTPEQYEEIKKLAIEEAGNL